MSDPLGKGLTSLIPNRPFDEETGLPSEESRDEQGAPRSSAPAAPADASPSPRQDIVADLSSSLPPDSPSHNGGSGARSYEDHFMPRRGESVFWIELEKIKPNPYQPRREFNEETLNDLAHSIREHGVLQPILVTKHEIETPTGIDIFYQLIAGERRWRAAQRAGLSQIPAVIRRGIPDDRIRLELAIIENVQREDLNAIERARAYRRLIDEFHLVQREIGNRIGKSREAVANVLRLLTLPEEIQLAVQKGQLSEGHARAILMSGENPLKQKEVFQAVLTESLSVREAESRARQVAGRMLIPRTRPAMIQNPEIREWQQRLEERLGTKVQFQKMGDRGRIVVEFYSDEELRGILAKFG